MEWSKICQGVLIAVLAAVVLGISGLVWNWTSKGGLVRALGGITQADLSDNLPLELWQRVSPDAVSEAFAQCNTDETPIAGECVLVAGAGLLFNAGIPTGQGGYHCLYTGSPTVRAYAYCANKKQIRISH